MATTTRLGLTIPNDTLNARTYLDTNLAADVQTIDADDHDGFLPFNVKRYGAVGDGVADDAAAVQAAVNAAIAAGKSVVYAPKGEYLLGSSVVVANGKAIRIMGAGQESTRFTWGGAGGIAFDFQDCQYCVLNDLEVFVDTPNSLTEAVRFLQKTSTTTVAPTQNHVHDVKLSGNGVMATGVLVTFDVTDANNEFHSFERVQATGYTHSAVRLNGIQVHLVRFTQVNFNGLDVATQTTPTGSYGIYADSPSGNQAASFVVDGGLIGGHAAADFYIGGSSQGVHIRDVSSENSVRLLVTGGPANAAMTVCLENVRYSSEQLNADGYYIKHYLGGSLILVGGTFGTNGTTSGSYPKIDLDGSGTINVRAIGAAFGWSQNGTGNNSTQIPPVRVSGAAAAYADIRFEGCRWVNQYATTEAAYTRQAGNPGATFSITAYYGEKTHTIAVTAPCTLTTIAAAYPNQKIVLLLENGNITVKHNDGGANSIYLRSAADFTPSVFPYAMQLQYSSAFGRWVEL